jgi:hypothetical protein
VSGSGVIGFGWVFVCGCVVSWGAWWFFIVDLVFVVCFFVCVCFVGLGGLCVLLFGMDVFGFCSLVGFVFGVLLICGCWLSFVLSVVVCYGWVLLVSVGVWVVVVVSLWGVCDLSRQV